MFEFKKSKIKPDKNQDTFLEVDWYKWAEECKEPTVYVNTGISSLMAGPGSRKEDWTRNQNLQRMEGTNQMGGRGHHEQGPVSLEGVFTPRWRSVGLGV